MPMTKILRNFPGGFADNFQQMDKSQCQLLIRVQNRTILAAGKFRRFQGCLKHVVNSVFVLKLLGHIGLPPQPAPDL